MKIITVFFTFFILNISILASVNLAKSNLLTKDKELFLSSSKNLLIDISNKKENPLDMDSYYEEYYKYNNYSPFWIDENGIKQISYDLLNIIKEDPVVEPFLNKLFKFEELDQKINLMNNNSNINDLILLDVTLTNIYHRYMTYLSTGLMNWMKFKKELKEENEKKNIKTQWRKYESRINLRELLYKAINENNISLAINSVNFTYPNANKLSQKIKEYKNISLNGGYIKVPMTQSILKKGNYYPEVKILRERLMQSNHLKKNECLQKFYVENCLELYDERVSQALKSFQSSHGLIVDGILGEKTINTLNITAEEKINKIRLNLERMRWMPRNLGSKYLIVNIPDYKLKYYDANEEIKLDMPIVVGEYNNPTAIFSNKISKIVLNPHWRIPQSIVKKEIIPKLVENRNYLLDENIKVFENWDHTSMQYDISNVDWSMYLNNDLIGNDKEAPMRFIQEPNKDNSLGKMKFLLPNPYSIYLHDTPEKELFKDKDRAYSHGCIRLSKPNELLEVILKEEKTFDYNKAKEVLLSDENTNLELNEKIPIHMVYLTTWVDENGKIQFRDDIYDYDKIQGKILFDMLL